MQALKLLDQLVAEELRLREKYDLPPGFRVPQRTETSIHQCAHCKQDMTLIIFGDNACDIEGLEAYARMMEESIKKTNLPTYIITPPSDPKDGDSPVLLLKVYPEREEACEIIPTEWDAILAALSAAHCSIAR